MEYRATDSILLICMIRHSEAERIVEIGTGYSSSVILDVTEKF